MTRLPQPARAWPSSTGGSSRISTRRRRAEWSRWPRPSGRSSRRPRQGRERGAATPNPNTSGKELTMLKRLLITIVSGVLGLAVIGAAVPLAVHAAGGGGGGDEGRP